MISRLSLLTTVALIGSLGAAAAQQTPSPQAVTPPSASQVMSDTAQGAIANGGKGAGTNATTGWNFFHIRYCYSFYYGSTFYTYFYPTEGGYWYTTDQRFQQQLYPNCVTGNWSGVYVTSTSGTWAYLTTYDYK
jgi:hypothetical protein